MITVKRLLDLLAQLPPDATLYAYEGEDVGINVCHGDREWWIRAREDSIIDDYIDGFD